MCGDNVYIMLWRLCTCL